MYFIAKTLITAFIIAAVSELSRRFTFIAALLVALPLTSILAFCWMYYDSRDVHKIAEMSYSVFWLVIPSLLFFLALPLLLKNEVSFPLAMLVSCAVTAAAYAGGIYLWRWLFPH